MTEFLSARQAVFKRLDTAKVQAITDLFNFFNNFWNVRTQNIDEQVRKTKINWWVNELDSLYIDRPSHPTLAKLTNHKDTYNWQKREFDSLADALCYDAQPESIDELIVLAEQSFGSIFVLISQVLGANSHDEIKQAKALGCCAFLWQVINDLGRDIRAGILLLPKSFEINTEQLAKFESSPQLRQALEQINSQAQLLFSENSPSSKLLPLVQLTAVERLRYNLALEDKLPVLQQAIYPPTWRLWLLIRFNKF